MKTIMIVLVMAGTMVTCKSKEVCAENPKEGCICTMDYTPVCGCNNKTYSNACAAECAGITDYKTGECK